MMRTVLARAARRLWAAKPRTPSRRACRPEVETLEARDVPAGTWTQFFPGNGGAFPEFTSTLVTMPDGRIFVNGYGGQTPHWYALSPDSSGNYINGTIAPIASMSKARLFPGLVVLPSDQMMVMGGEYINGAQDTDPTGEIYTMSTNTWAPTTIYPTGHFGDDTLQLLPNGNVLGTSIFDGQIFSYNVASNSWSPLATKIGNDASDEESMIKLPPSATLPQGGILAYSIFTSPSTTGSGPQSLAQLYNIATNQWISTGNVPIALSASSVPGDNNFYEIGPGLLLPSNGKVFQMGGVPTYSGGVATTGGHTAIYDPASNTWTQGPDIPVVGYANDDGPSAVLPDGNVIFTADKPFSTGPVKLFEYNPTTNTIIDLSPQLPITLLNEFSDFNQGSGIAGYLLRMTLAPNGHLLLATTFQYGNGAGGDIWDYSETGSINPAWRPRVFGMSFTGAAGSGQFTLTGQQLNGLDEGTLFGDDIQNATNFPIVRLVSITTGQSYYARTSNWTQPGEVATGSTIGSTVFTLPTALNTAGNYILTVIANGIASFPMTLNISASQLNGGQGAFGDGGDSGMGSGSGGSGALFGGPQGGSILSSASASQLTGTNHVTGTTSTHTAVTQSKTTTKSKVTTTHHGPVVTGTHPGVLDHVFGPGSTVVDLHQV
jgi:hypothetical protein